MTIVENNSPPSLEYDFLRSHWNLTASKFIRTYNFVNNVYYSTVIVLNYMVNVHIHDSSMVFSGDEGVMRKIGILSHSRC